jgi:hypothetical protein
VLPFTLKYQSARSEYFAFPNPILKDKYVLLLYAMGLATVGSILIGTTHPSPNIPQLKSPYLTSSVGTLKSIF